VFYSLGGLVCRTLSPRRANTVWPIAGEKEKEKPLERAKEKRKRKESSRREREGKRRER
jgi:hypothetical protein